MRWKISPMWIWIVQGLIIVFAATVLVTSWDKAKEFEKLGPGTILCICIVVFFLGLVEGLVIHILGTWLYHRFIQSDAPCAWYDHIEVVERAFSVAYRGGIWVEPNRSRLNKHYYDYLISTAREIRVLGIANRNFMKNLEKDFPNTDAAGSFSLKHSLQQPLFERLCSRDEVNVDVLFLDPTCPEAQDRSKESNNKETMSDLYKVGRALRRVKQAFDRDSTNRHWNLTGRLRFYAISKIPENSIALVDDMQDSHRTLMVVGALPRGEFGEKCPSIIIQRLDELKDLFQTFSSKVDEIKKVGKLAFTWDVKGPRLEPWLEDWLNEWEAPRAPGARTVSQGDADAQ